MNVTHNVSFAAGSIYEVALNPSTASLIKAGGTATITGGDVRVLAGQGNYAPLYKYTILTANGGVTGQFNGVTTNLAFLTPSLTEDANNVHLTLIATTSASAISAARPTSGQGRGRAKPGANQSDL
jgi:hypothetical protein